MWILKYYKYIEKLCKDFKLSEDDKQDLYYDLLLKGDISQLDNPKGYLFNSVKYAAWYQHKKENRKAKQFERIDS